VSEPVSFLRVVGEGASHGSQPNSFSLPATDPGGSIFGNVQQDLGLRLVIFGEALLQLKPCLSAMGIDSTVGQYVRHHETTVHVTIVRSEQPI